MGWGGKGGLRWVGRSELRKVQNKVSSGEVR